MSERDRRCENNKLIKANCNGQNRVCDGSLKMLLLVFSRVCVCVCGNVLGLNQQRFIYFSCAVRMALIVYRWRSLLNGRVRRPRASKRQGSSERVLLPWQVTMDQLICCFKKNQNTPRPFEHPPVRGGGMSKRLVGGIKGYKFKTTSWHLNRFPDGNNIGSTV